MLVTQMRGLGRGAVADGVELGQRSHGARGKVLEVAGYVAGIDDDRPATRQGEDQRVLGTAARLGAFPRDRKQEARRWSQGGAPCPADGAERAEPLDDIAASLGDGFQEINGELQPVGLFRGHRTGLLVHWCYRDVRVYEEHVENHWICIRIVRRRERREYILAPIHNVLGIRSNHGTTVGFSYIDSSSFQLWYLPHNRQTAVRLKLQ